MRKEQWHIAIHIANVAILGISVMCLCHRSQYLDHDVLICKSEPCVEIKEIHLTECTWAFAISSAFKRYFAFELQSVGVMLWSIFLCQRPQKNIWSSWTFDSQSNHLQFASIPVFMRLCALESYFDPPRLISVARWHNWHMPSLLLMARNTPN